MSQVNNLRPRSGSGISGLVQTVFVRTPPLTSLAGQSLPHFHTPELVLERRYGNFNCGPAEVDSDIAHTLLETLLASPTTPAACGSAHQDASNTGDSRFIPTAFNIISASRHWNPPPPSVSRFDPGLHLGVGVAGWRGSRTRSPTPCSHDSIQISQPIL